VTSVSDAAAWGDVIMILTPDHSQGETYAKEIAPHMKEGQDDHVRHGFNIRFGAIQPPRRWTCRWCAEGARTSRARGVHRGRRRSVFGAVHQDASGHALKQALSYAKGLAGRAAAFWRRRLPRRRRRICCEQAVLCGGTSALVKAGFDTLVEAGYQPEIAYFECCMS